MIKSIRDLLGLGRQGGGVIYQNLLSTLELPDITERQTVCLSKLVRKNSYFKDNGMGNTCKSMADSCQCMTKTTTIL